MRYALMATLFLLMPRFLVHAGNAAGTGSLAFIALLPVILVIHASVMACRMQAPESGLSRSASVLTQLAHLLTLLSLGTLALGVSGFTFNEVFVRWFPNLGFSFGMLGVAGLLCLLGQDQLHTLLALLGLCAMGCIVGVAARALPWPLVLPELHLGNAPWNVALIAAPLLLGADLALGPQGMSKGGLSASVVSMVLAALVMALLGWAGLMVLEPGKLAAYALPQMVIARLSMGNDGRMLMGGAGLLCTLGGVVLLLRAATGITDQTGLNKFARALLGCALLAVMLGLGFSGEELTETLLLVAIGTWLLANALTCLSAGAATGRLLPMIGLLGSLGLLTAWLLGNWEHVQYAPHYLEQFIGASV